MICARRTSPAPSFCERVIRAGLCASSSLNPRTRSVIATSPAWTRAPCNAPDPEKSYPTCRMHHLDAALICDDIRTENTGKQILIGVYGDDIIVGMFPSVVVVALWMRFRFDEVGMHPLELMGDGPDGSVLAASRVEAYTANKSANVDLGLGGIVLQLNRPGRITFRWRDVGQDEWKDVIDLSVAQGNVAISRIA